LVAVPELSDPHFRQTLVFLHDHGADGSLGLILNRPVGKCLSDLLNEAELPELLRDTPIFYGGPVQPEQVLLALFTLDAAGVLRCELKPSADHICEARRDPRAWLRAFVGYAGWSGGQLEDELQRQDWRLDRPDPALFDARFCTRLWPLYALGDPRWHSLVPHLPREPDLN
jgi:putative transcriptional regulator